MEYENIPPKFAKLMLDEQAIAARVSQLGNIFYHEAWLLENRGLKIHYPDGIPKSLFVPIRDFSKEQIVAFVGSLRPELPLVSGALSLQMAYISIAHINLFDQAEEVIQRASFPLLQIEVYLKHVEPLVEQLVEHGFIDPTRTDQNAVSCAQIIDRFTVPRMWGLDAPSGRGFTTIRAILGNPCPVEEPHPPIASQHD